MPILVTREAPDFTADAVFPGGSIDTFALSNWKGKYICLLFYPMDFSYVCPSEIIAFNQKIEEFHKRNCKIAAISTDTEFTHHAWISTDLKHGGVGEVNFPLISDKTKDITRMYGVLYAHAVALRGLFLIDKEGIVRHELINDLPLGRSVNEALRMLDALRFYEKHGNVCPANWQPGDNGIEPSREGVVDYMASVMSCGII